MNMEAFVLGSGGTMPLPSRHLTSVLLRREGEVFLFDAGEGTQVSLRCYSDIPYPRGPRNRPAGNADAVQPG
jgi:ribonuclease BN (tRNA processing enzyme)